MQRFFNIKGFFMLWNKGDRDYKQCWTELRQCLVPELWCHFLLQTPVAGSHPDRMELSDQLPLDHTAHPLPGNPQVSVTPLYWTENVSVYWFYQHKGNTQSSSSQADISFVFIWGILENVFKCGCFKEFHFKSAIVW